MKPPSDPDELLARMSIVGAPGLYCFGYRHALLSIRAQQIRALNLAAALNATNVIPRAPVVVVGAGVAGLTLAAAIVELGGKAKVVDHAPTPMGNLRNATHRYLHPNMLRWPDPNWDNPNAEMPLLNWSADWGDRVWQHLWDSLEPYIERGLSIELGIQGLEIARDGADRWRARWGRPPPEAWSAEQAVVVLALGPGHESTVYGSPRYWDLENDALNRPLQAQHILVSGTGDGGLIDASRRCLYDRRRHQRIDHLTLLSLWVVSSDMDDGRLRVSQNTIQGHVESERWDVPDAVDLLQRANPDREGLSLESCEIHRDLVAALIHRNAIRILQSPSGLPRFTYRADTSSWVPELPDAEVSPEYHPGGYQRIYVRHGPTLAVHEQALAQFFSTADELAQALALLGHVTEFRETEQPVLLEDVRRNIQGVAGLRQNLSWSHHAGDLYCEIQDLRNRLPIAERRPIERESVGIYLQLLGNHPERATWLHSDLGRRGEVRAVDLYDAARKIAIVIQDLMYELDGLLVVADASEGPLQPPPPVRWIEQLLTSGSLCSRERGVLLPPKSGWTPIWAPHVDREISMSYARACHWNWDEWDASHWPELLAQHSRMAWCADNAESSVTILDLVTVAHDTRSGDQNVVRYLFGQPTQDWNQLAAEVEADHVVPLT